MRNIFTALLFFISISLFSQDEKRLALVIGNANYDKGELKNPVNDARLIASTLDSLDFDVILKENLATKRDMTTAIREFGSKRSEYDVAFVYYAGHGIQVDDENFLLPTREVFEEEFDVMDYGVSVQNIMRYLKAQTNEVNILILDACRDNPFESNWNTTRSLKGSGLAKIPPPTGSLIAFSTDSGQTAPDGDGDNSTYTISLAKNMLLEDTSIDQVFRNVRAEVLAETDGKQRPVEATQLTGQTFFLRPGTYEDELNEIDNILYSFKNVDKALEKINIILSKDPGYYKALQRKAHTLTLLEQYKEADSIYKHLYNIDPNDPINVASMLIHDNFQYTDTGFLGNYCDECDSKSDLQNYIDISQIKLKDKIQNPWFIIKFLTLSSRVHDEWILKKIEDSDLEFKFDNDEKIPLFENKRNRYPQKFVNIGKEFSEDEIIENFQRVIITNKNFDIVEFYNSIIVGSELINTINNDNFDKSEIILEKYYNDIDPNFEKFYSGLINYWVGPVFKAVGKIDRGNEILLKTIENNENLTTQLDSRLELYLNLLAQGKFDEGIKYLEKANEIISSGNIPRVTYEKFLTIILLYIADHYMIVDGDAISSLKAYEKMTEDDEIRKYILDNYIAYAYYNQYLCNMLNNRFNVAKQNLNNFISYLNDNELNYYSSGKFRLKKNGEFFDWNTYEGEEFIENGHSFKILNDDDIVIELFNVDGVMSINMWDRKNRLFETLSNNDLRYTIDQISTNLKIPKKIISYLTYTISYRSVFDDLYRKSIQ